MVVTEKQSGTSAQCLRHLITLGRESTRDFMMWFSSFAPGYPWNEIPDKLRTSSLTAANFDKMNKAG